MSKSSKKAFSLIRALDLNFSIDDIKVKSAPWIKSAEYIEDIYSVRLETMIDVCDFSKSHESDTTSNRVEIAKDLQLKIPKLEKLVTNLKNHLKEEVVVYEFLINDEITLTAFFDSHTEKLLGYFDF